MAKHHGKGRGTGKEPMVASGNPDVIAEAEDKEKKYEAKHGGRMKKHKKTGGVVVLGKMTGGAVRPRLDRPGRKMGGRVGSDSAPLSSAHRSVSAETTPNPND